MPPDMPAAKLRPVAPSTTTVPPVMYSQPWSPRPHTARRPGAHGEALAGDAAEIGLVDRAIQGDVASNNVLGRLAAELRRGLH